ncbi:N-6 DNA methylase [Streptomyces pseudovenezuelae]|uniref:N-6 DNA methylase n=1 Tax=Streptomyces pseudovenezuelae TaxID=67350 RepID=UPI0036DFC20B
MSATYQLPLTADSLEDFLFRVAERVRGEVDFADFPRLIGPLLLLKRASDQPGFLDLPEDARWSVALDRGAPSGAALNGALHALELNNPGLRDLFHDLDFDNVRQSRRVILQLVDMINELPLSDENLEFSDVVGRAFDGLLRRTASAMGKKSESFTPRAVCRLMTELVDPGPGQSVADPHVGSGGMLLSAAQYIAEHGGDPAEVGLYGQEKNATAWFTGKLNLLLHGFTEPTVSHSDSLTDPLEYAGQLARFDRVLTAPPFSMNYSRDMIRHPERMLYGWVPEGGKKADLMFVQHVLSVLRPDGTGAVVVPQGVLFRGGTEGEIRRGLVEDDRLEAVIGIGANVFYNTGIPASILVLKGHQGRAADRRGTVLFIDAEREMTVGRSRNRLDAQHIAKIVDAFLGRTDVPGFARVVPLEELRENDFNLNIRRYVDASPPPEPLLDISAALVGGVPQQETEKAADAFHAFGIRLDDLFVPDRPGYWRFPAAGYEATAARIPLLASAQEEDFLTRFQDWWTGRQETVRGLADGGLAPANVRAELEATLCQELLRLGILDRYQLLGAVASWWSDQEDALRALTAYGFPAVLRHWRSIPRDRTDPRRPPKNFHPPGDAQSVLDVLGDSLRRRVGHLVTGERQKLVETYLRWGERYATSMADLEDRYRTAADRLRDRMTDLGYF